MEWIKVDHVPAIGIMVRLSHDDESYVGTVFCTPYSFRGETHFAIQWGENRLVFNFEKVTIEILKGEITDGKT